jgi:hypothetical protein
VLGFFKSYLKITSQLNTQSYYHIFVFFDDSVMCTTAGELFREPDISIQSKAMTPISQSVHDKFLRILRDFFDNSIERLKYLGRGVEQNVLH